MRADFRARAVDGEARGVVSPATTNGGRKGEAFAAGARSCADLSGELVMSPSSERAAGSEAMPQAG